MMRQVLFIHIPRTAGTSIHQAMRGRKGFQDLVHMRQTLRSQPFDFGKQFTTIGHNRPSELCLYGVTREWIESCLRFTFVRNPWDRLVSLYHNMRGVRLSARYGKDATKGANPCLRDFGSFIHEVTDPDSPALRSGKVRESFSSALPQTHWLEEGMSFVGRYEHLDRDWGWLCGAAGLKHRLLERHGKTERSYYRDYYDQELQELVARDRAEFIERFKYVF